jgi:hypothetical protein
VTLTAYDDRSLAYQEARHAIERQITWHRRHHGGDPDELQGEAHLAFMDAYDTYDPSYGACFATWASNKVRHRLKEYVRTLSRRAERIPVYVPHDKDEDLLGEVVQPDTHRGCPPDAAELIRAALSDDADILITAGTINDTSSPVSVRLAVYEYFRSLGWGVTRLAEAFGAVREVI